MTDVAAPKLLEICTYCRNPVRAWQAPLQLTLLFGLATHFDGGASRGYPPEAAELGEKPSFFRPGIQRNQ